MNTGGKAPACVPTWRGHIETTKDALLIFEACFNGTLSHCFRRPHDRERNQLIVSGNVFVYEEATSGIKRWTDGIPWSPSRILTNFLIYRQLNSPFPPGEKKRATKRSQRALKPGEPYAASGSANTPTTTEDASAFSPGSPTPSGLKKEDSPEKDVNRGLVGSLVDSYEFKENGLLKKTMTVTVNNVQHHLVSYYSLDDAKYKLKTPRDEPRLKDLQIRDALMNQPKFKFPNLDDAGDGTFEQMDGSPNAYPAYYPNGYDSSRMYPTPQHQTYQVSSPLAYHPAVYAPSHPPSTPSSYAHMPPSTSAYAPIASAGQYAQQQSHPQYYPQHNQSLSQYQGQGAQAQQSAQYQSPQYQMHQSSVPIQPMRHSSVKSESSGALRRPSGAFEYLSGAQHDNVHDSYGGDGGSDAPHSQSMLPLSQSQPTASWMGYSSPSPWGIRQEGASYPSYRAQS